MAHFIATTTRRRSSFAKGIHQAKHKNDMTNHEKKDTQKPDERRPLHYRGYNQRTETPANLLRPPNCPTPALAIAS